MQAHHAASPLDAALKALREKESYGALPSSASTAQPVSRVMSGASPTFSLLPIESHQPGSHFRALNLSASGIRALNLSASELNSSPSPVTLDPQPALHGGLQPPLSTASGGGFLTVQLPLSSARPTLSAAVSREAELRHVADDQMLPNGDYDAEFDFSPFTQRGAAGTAAKTGQETTLTVHCIFGYEPYHKMLPDARLKLFHFIKRALYTHREADRVALSFWCPARASSLQSSDNVLSVPNVMNFGRHSITHSFLDDFFSCALEMHSLNLLDAGDFAYHVFHSFSDVVPSLGRMHNENKSTQRWEIGSDIENVLFYKSVFQDIPAYAEYYCATAMQARNSSTQHALICMGGDISSLFVIKTAIEQGTIVFIVAQTGKLADCIAEVVHMQKQSKEQSEIAASLAHILKRCTGRDEGGSDTGDIWLHVSILQLKSNHLLAAISFDFCSLTGFSPKFSSLESARRSCSSRAVPSCMS